MRDDKIIWIACASWAIKEIIDKGLLKGFDKSDYQAIKLINKTYNKAYKEKDFDLLMIGDKFAEQVSDKAFKRLKNIYEHI